MLYIENTEVLAIIAELIHVNFLENFKLQANTTIFKIETPYSLKI